MRKLLIAVICSILSLGGSAQTIRSTSSERVIIKDTSSWNHSGWFINTGVGVLTGDNPASWDWAPTTDLGWAFGTGYRWHISNGFSWEIIRVGFNTDVSHFVNFYLRGTTGLRYDSNRLDALKGRTLYANVAVGFGYDTAYAWAGPAYELGFGAKLSRNWSLGLVLQGNTALTNGDAHWLLFGAQVEVLF